MVDFIPEKPLDISAWGFKEPVVIKRFSNQNWAAVQRALDKSNNLKIKEIPMDEDSDPVVELTPGYEQDNIYCVYGIKSAPFPIDSTAIGDLDGELVEFISLEVQKLNDYFFREKRSRGKGKGGKGSGGVKVSSSGDSSPASPPVLNAHVTTSRRS